MGHLYHGYVSHNQRVIIVNFTMKPTMKNPTSWVSFRTRHCPRERSRWALEASEPASCRWPQPGQAIKFWPSEWRDHLDMLCLWCRCFSSKVPKLYYFFWYISYMYILYDIICIDSELKPPKWFYWKVWGVRPKWGEKTTFKNMRKHGKLGKIMEDNEENMTTWQGK